MNLKKKFVVGAASVALIASMGGVAAPAAVADTNRLPGYATELGRLGGIDRIQTALAIADHEFGHRTANKPGVLYIASAADANMVDAASAGMLQDGPIAFVYGNSYVASAVGKHFADDELVGYSDIKKIIAIGGEGAVSDAAMKAVGEEMGVKSFDRLGGKDRFETSVAIASRIYNHALQSTDAYLDRAGNHIVSNGTNLNVMYLANGANEHVVDSMVAGTLDNGPVVLVNADGTIPDVAAEFIKKTLPLQFAALGGAPTVSDKTVQDAWLIKALANKWETSSSIPQLKVKQETLKALVDGKGNKTDRVTGSDDFMGLRNVVREAGNLQTAWNGQYGEAVAKLSQISKVAAHNNRADVENALAGATMLNYPTAAYKADSPSTSATDYASNVATALRALFGEAVLDSSGAIDKTKIEKYIDIEPYDTSDMNKDHWKVVGFDYKALLGSKSFQNAYVAPAEKALTDQWKAAMDGTVVALGNPVAEASQNTPTAAEAAGNYTSNTADAHRAKAVPMAAVKDVAEWVTAQQQQWLKDTEAELADVSGRLAGELDKIAPKTELRLGGADRFETAQLIANQYGKLYGTVFNKGLTANVMTEAYVANGTRLPDSLAGGQLSHGPIMLVRDSTDIPAFTKDVATHLQCWNKAGNIGVAALGGKGVVSDETLKAVISLINTASACGTVKSTAKTTPLSVTETDVSVSAAAVEAASGDVDATLTIDGYAAGVTAGITYSATVTSPVTATTGGGNETVALGNPAIDANGKVKATVTKSTTAAKAGDSFVITITASRAGEVVNTISKTITLTA
ncbi:cell wall-binding repeat-containing protein [uncultured Mobiluncus sp.]|uniref:cell wall-binding repeat-containing protein n=1 Tax=uncultured Mobiluncus sp. TaxID=293425 RepID=UPI002624B5A9|nr:cell wall-binding repeat-containing protein [uncultured Mobiluncus sp.]